MNENEMDVANQEQDSQDNWKHKYDSLYNRVAPVQRKLAQAEQDLAKEREEKEEMRKQLQQFSTRSTKILDLEAQQYAEETIKSTLTEEELEDLDPSVIKLQKAAIAKMYKDSKEKIPSNLFFEQPEDKTLKDNVSANSFDDKNDVLAQRATARINKYIQDTSTNLHKAYERMNDPEFIQKVNSDPELSADLSAFLSSKDVEEVMEMFPTIESRLSSIFDIAPPASKKQKKQEEILDPQTSISGSRYLARTKDDAELQQELQTLINEHAKYVKSRLPVEREHARSIMTKIDEVRRKIYSK